MIFRCASRVPNIRTQPLRTFTFHLALGCRTAMFDRVWFVYLAICMPIESLTVWGNRESHASFRSVLLLVAIIRIRIGPGCCVLMSAVSFTSIMLGLFIFDHSSTTDTVSYSRTNSGPHIISGLSAAHPKPSTCLDTVILILIVHRLSDVSAALRTWTKPWPRFAQCPR